VAIYCRVSTGDQDNVRQERDLEGYAERAGFEVVAVFREVLPGMRRARRKRPVERGRAMAWAREIDAVLVTEPTRWGRSTQALMDTLGQLASWDVSLIAQTGSTVRAATTSSTPWTAPVATWRTAVPAPTTLAGPTQATRTDTASANTPLPQVGCRVAACPAGGRGAPPTPGDHWRRTAIVDSADRPSTIHPNARGQLGRACLDAG
jgi:cell division septation protein DedD